MRQLLVLVLLLSVLPALAIDEMQAMDDPALQARYERLTDELRCLVCQNQSIADSTADLADDLRRQVRTMLSDGASDEEILDYMVARYGDFVRYRPAFNEKTAMLWIGPFVLLGAGLAIGTVVILRRAREAREPGE